VDADNPDIWEFLLHDQDYLNARWVSLNGIVAIKTLPTAN